MKLYWRVKINGKWTWRTATSWTGGGHIWVQAYKPDEEE